MKSRASAGLEDKGPLVVTAGQQPSDSRMADPERPGDIGWGLPGLAPGQSLALLMWRQGRWPAHMHPSGLRPGPAFAGTDAPSLTGFRNGYRRANAELRREVDETIDQLNDAAAEVRAEMRAMRSEFARLQAIESASNAERNESTALN